MMQTKGWNITDFYYELHVDEFYTELIFLVELRFEKDFVDNKNKAASKGKTRKKYSPAKYMDKMKKEKAWAKKIEKEILQKGIPYLSFELPKVFTAGVSLTLMTHNEIQVFGRLDFNVGAKWKVEKNSLLRFNINKPEDNKIRGWHKSAPELIFKPQSGNIEGNLLMYPAPRFDIGLSLFEVTDLQLQTLFRIPAINMNLSAGFGE